MKKLKLNVNSKYIVLRDGYNKPLIIGSIIAIAFTIILATSKLWMPDDREIMSYDSTVMTFSMREITKPERVIYDKEKGILEMELTESHLSNDKKFDVSYYCTSPDYNGKLPIEIIKGDLSKSGDSQVIEHRKVLLQIRVPEDWWYITVNVKQKDNITIPFNVDYRSVQASVIEYKGKDFLTSLDSQKNELTKQKQEQETKHEELQKLTEEIKQLYTALSKAKGDEKKKLTADLNKKKAKTEKLQKEYDLQQKDIKAVETLLKKYGG